MSDIIMSKTNNYIPTSENITKILDRQGITEKITQFLKLRD
jgi:hypothetical protein